MAETGLGCNSLSNVPPKLPPPRSSILAVLIEYYVKLRICKRLQILPASSLHYIYPAKIGRGETQKEGRFYAKHRILCQLYLTT